MKLLVIFLPVLLCVYMAVQSDLDPYLIALAFTIYTVIFLLLLFQDRYSLKRHLSQIANLFEALNNGDYQVRSTINGNEQENYISKQINGLIDKLAHQTGALEEQRVLLCQVIEHMNTVLIAMNEHGEIILSNYKAKQLLEFSKVDGSDTKLLNILINANSEEIITLSDDGIESEFLLKREKFFRHGKKHQLIVLSEVGQLLSHREATSWKRLMRIMSHEINNSIMPIKNISHALKLMVTDSDENRKISQGIKVIEERSEYLSRFIGNYCRLAQLPDPCRQPVQLISLLASVTPLFPQCHFIEEVEQETTLLIDPIQIQQAFINILKNADEAMKGKDKNILIKCVEKPRYYTIDFIDSGTGINNPDNLFIPFYSTKPDGTGIGLMLSRQIINNHEGHMAIFNREDQQGAVVRITLRK